MGLTALCSQAQDTVYVSGSVHHDGLFPTMDVSGIRPEPRAGWAKIDHLSNNYLDLSVHWLRQDSNALRFKGLHVDTRVEMNEWPLPGYDESFAGHGLGRLSLTADFDWGHVSVGDVYGQFGSGMILNLYENRDLGIDNSLRGAKIDLTPYKGIHLTFLGGKQRRYWNCYEDGAWGWNYRRDAAMGADVELNISEWAPVFGEQGLDLTVGGSYVSKYEASDTVLVPENGKLYMYNLPRWIGAGEVRAEVQGHGWDALVEYAYKANDPTIENGFSYRPGQALLLSLSYSQKGLSVLAQVKRSENMSFRSARKQTGINGRLNLLPVFTPQNTYILPALYPYTTRYTKGEWAFQAEVCYTWPRKTKMGGRYGTTLKLSAAHVQGLKEANSWAVKTGAEGAYYTDVHLELNKKITKRWSTNAMLLYIGYNQQAIEGEGVTVHAGAAIWENKVQITDNVALRSEWQYLFTRQDAGQWIFALLELNLWHHLTLSGQWEYNIGGAVNETKDHYYAAEAVYTHGAHRLAVRYCKTSGGYNCSGGVCRYEPEQEGVKMSYGFTW